VLELLGSRRVVHRERCRAEQQRRRVGDVELRAVGQQQADRVPRAHAQRREPGRDAPGLLAVLAPGERDGLVCVQQRRLVAAALGGRKERVGERRDAGCHRVGHRATLRGQS
jgi:hypothetical protein